MSTNNFYNKNASKIFAIESDNDDQYPDDVMIHDLKLNIIYELPEFVGHDSPESDGNSSYGGVVFGIYHLPDEDSDIEARFELIIRSGYYSGYNLDWNIEVADFRDCGSTSYKEIEGSFREKIDAKIKEIEEVYAQNSIPLVKVSQLNNGEAVYQKA